MASSYTRKLQQIVDDYRKAGGPWPAKKTEIALWAMEHGRWEIQAEAKLRVCAEDIAAAMRESSIIDEKGRRVRVMHPATIVRDGEQGTFWDDLRTAEFGFVRTMVAQKRNAIVADCHQLSNIVRYVNEHREQQLNLVLDFTEDVRELEAQLESGAEPKAELNVGQVEGMASTRDLPLRRRRREAATR
ncbi:MAG: hypothetical protein KF709_02890 [Gemmatimonadaceae bacterium]|nr:hypothetical protein [Gemmatimonadaceae bacterium]